MRLDERGTECFSVSGKTEVTSTLRKTRELLGYGIQLLVPHVLSYTRSVIQHLFSTSSGQPWLLNILPCFFLALTLSSHRFVARREVVQVLVQLLE